MKSNAARRIYLREAALMLTLARLAIRLLPAERVIAWASRPPRCPSRFAAHQAASVAWAVNTIGDKPWMKAKCLPRALAAQAMLRRRGVASKLCLGVARESSALAAHAWLELGQQTIVGGADTPRYTRLLELGGERA